MSGHALLERHADLDVAVGRRTFEAPRQSAHEWVAKNWNLERCKGTNKSVADELDANSTTGVLINLDCAGVHLAAGLVLAARAKAHGCAVDCDSACDSGKTKARDFSSHV